MFPELPKEVEEMQNRREWLQRTLLAGLGCGLAGRGVADSTPNRPNFVFINVDDLAWDAVGHAGRYPFLKTPHIDRLAAEGARFSNAFVTISLCSPSRACSLTGRHAHANGVRMNSRHAPHPSLPTYPQELQRAGYATAHVGKWHMQGSADPRPGFDYWLSFKGQGRYENPPLNENGRTFQATGYMTDILTDYAVDWIANRPKDKPFCLNLWHKAVHGPFTPAPRHAALYPALELPEPASFGDTMADKPEWMRRAVVHGGKRKAWKENLKKPVPAEIKPRPWNPRSKGHLNYLRSIQAVDESLGRVFEALEEAGVLDSTCIIFTSDNGFFLGEHRRGDKRLAYEESMRVPLLFRFPPLVAAGSVRQEMALNIDVAPTLLALAGASIPSEMQGRSLVPLLAGNKTNWRESFLYEYFQEPQYPSMPTILAVRTDHWKLVTYPDLSDDIDELYDLRTDPRERHNLVLDPAHADTLGKLRLELERLKKETGFHDKLPPRSLTKQKLALHYDLRNAKDGAIQDQSGHGWHGARRNFPGGATDKGLHFEGKSRIELAPTPAGCDPSGKALCVAAWATPESEAGVLASFGGASQGFSLHLQEGRPAFAVRSGGSLAEAKASHPLSACKRVHLAGILTDDEELLLLVNGKVVAQGASGYISSPPNDVFCIGGDAHSAVGDYKAIPWRGWIEEVRMYWGAPDEKIRLQWRGKSSETGIAYP
jgi:N-acetylglucosamine-6-sulfatase